MSAAFDLQKRAHTSGTGDVVLARTSSTDVLRRTVYTSDTHDVAEYTFVTLSIRSQDNFSVNGIKPQFSAAGTTWHDANTVDINYSTSTQATLYMTVPVAARFFRYQITSQNADPEDRSTRISLTFHREGVPIRPRARTYSPLISATFSSAGTTNSAAIQIFGAFGGTGHITGLFFHNTITSGNAGDLLQIYVQGTLDGTSWYTLLKAPNRAGNAAGTLISSECNSIRGGRARIGTVDSLLSVDTTRRCRFARYARISVVYTGTGGSNYPIIVGLQLA